MKIIKIISFSCLIFLASCSSVTNNQTENQNQEVQSEKGQIEMVGVHSFSNELLDKINSELKGDKWVTSYFYLEKHMFY